MPRDEIRSFCLLHQTCGSEVRLTWNLGKRTYVQGFRRGSPASWKFIESFANVLLSNRVVPYGNSITVLFDKARPGYLGFFS